MNHIFRFFRHSRGFSLTEVMIGGAVLAGVGLAGARMFKDQKEAQKRVNMDNALNTYHASLVKIVQNANNCNATLRDWYNVQASGVGGMAPWTAIDLTNIYTCTGCTVEGYDYNASVSAIPNASRSLFVTEGQWTDGTQTWKVKTLDLEPPSQGTGNGKIIVTYELNPRMNSGTAKTIKRDANINMRFDQTTRQFKECLSGGESSVNNLQHDICESMRQVSSNGNVMQWNDQTQKCETIGTTASPLKTCPAGTLVDGISTNGTVRCRNATQGTVPNQDLMLTSPCAPGTSVKLDIIDGKVKTTCQ